MAPLTINNAPVLLLNEYLEEAAEFCNNSGKYFIEEIEPLDDGTRRFEIKEIPGPDFAELKEIKINENNNKCEESRYNFHFIYKNGYFTSSVQTVQDLQFAMMLIVGDETYRWVDDVGNIIELTQQMIKEILNIIKNINESCYELWKNYYDEIQSATTIEELNNINIIYNIGNDGTLS